MLLTSTPAWAEVVVIIRREAQSAGKYIRVGDIARVDGPQDQVREVAATILGPAPSHGESRNITRWDIENRLLEMGIMAKVAFSGNDHVRVLGSGAGGGSAGSQSYRDQEFEYQPLNPVPATSLNGTRRNRDFGTDSGAPVSSRSPAAPSADGAARPGTVQFELSQPQGSSAGRLGGDVSSRVAGVISTYIGERYRSGKNRPDVEVETRILSIEGSITPDVNEIAVEEALDGRVPGKAELRLRLRDRDGSAPRFVSVVAETTVFAPALVAVRNISRGESLSARDFGVTRIKMESGKAYMPPNPAVVEGRESTRSMRPGEPLLAQDAQPGEAVKRGTMVIVKAVGKGWEIQSKAKAQGSGTVGDIITVEDSNNRNKFPARIIGRGMVEVIVNRDHTTVDK